MKTSETDRLARVILESSRIHENGHKALISQTTASKANEEKFRQARRRFDQKYSLSTPPELMNF